MTEHAMRDLSLRWLTFLRTQYVSRRRFNRRMAMVQATLDRVSRDYLLLVGNSHAEMAGDALGIFDWPFVNAGVGGASARDLAARVPKLLVRSRAATAILFIGSNDIRRARGVDAGEAEEVFARSIDSVIAWLAAHAVTVWVAAIPPIGTAAIELRDPTLIEPYNSLLREAAHRRGARFFDPFTSRISAERPYPEKGLDEFGLHLDDYASFAADLVKMVRPDQSRLPFARSSARWPWLLHSRSDLLRAGLSRSDRLIELTRRSEPLLRASDGYDVTHVACCPSSDSGAQVAPGSDIAETTALPWRGEPLADLFPSETHGTFDVILASHIVADLPDLIGFLDQARRLIRSSGQIILAIPDKRMCFDHFRPLSTAADAIIAHDEGHRRPTKKALFDYVAYAASKGGAISWYPRDDGAFRLMHPLEAALAACRASDGAPHLEPHSWVFTPSSFCLLILELGALGQIDLKVAEMVRAPALEFYVWLTPGVEILGAEVLHGERVRLLTEIDAELRGWGLVEDHGGKRAQEKRSAMRSPGR